MNLAEHLKTWFLQPPMAGRFALLCGIVLLALPTVIRAALDGIVTGCEFTPYLPFVLLSAIVMRPWHASAVALASVGLLGVLFMGSPTEFLPSECFLSSAGIFLASSSIIIGVVVLGRRLVAAVQAKGADEASDEIVFSLEKEEVWASWYGNETPVRLGPENRVSEMMEDFLAQVELGKRLDRRSK
jgi:hypothetical protein